MQHLNAQYCNYITQQMQKFELQVQKTPPWKRGIVILELFGSIVSEHCQVADVDIIAD